MALELERIDDLEQDLKSRAFLYDDPTTFRAAIGLAMSMVRDRARTGDEATKDEQSERELRPPGL